MSTIDLVCLARADAESTIGQVEKGEAISSSNLLRVLLALNQGSDFLKMLETPNFPSLKAHERYLQLTTAEDPSLSGRRVRCKGLTASTAPEKKDPVVRRLQDINASIEPRTSL